MSTKRSLRFHQKKIANNQALQIYIQKEDEKPQNRLCVQYELFSIFLERFGFSTLIEIDDKNHINNIAIIIFNYLIQKVQMQRLYRPRRYLHQGK